ncbi:hypothetical protein DFH06DRAFT_1348654 [Mycena polygramma]|nr:hypothetical protein DFH06DRAFT_1348654 [Mycena polygramma]
MSSYASSSERPTLPPLHTLNLLPGPASYAPRPQSSSAYDSYDRSCPRLDESQHSWAHARRVSTSTSSSSSRMSSPTPSDASSASSSSTSPTSFSRDAKLTLVPSSFADAEAVVVVPPSDCQSQPQTLLITGRALANLRQGQRPLAKGTRVHPYRFAHASSRSRRASSASSVPSA